MRGQPGMSLKELVHLAVAAGEAPKGPERSREPPFNASPDTPPDRGAGEFYVCLMSVLPSPAGLGRDACRCPDRYLVYRTPEGPLIPFVCAQLDRNFTGFAARIEPAGPVLASGVGIRLAHESQRQRAHDGGFTGAVVSEKHMPPGGIRLAAQIDIQMSNRPYVLDGQPLNVHRRVSGLVNAPWHVGECPSHITARSP